MSMTAQEVNTRPCWFVGAWYSDKGDQFERFLQEGIWENGFGDDHPTVALTKTIQAGDRIAVKSVYVRKNDLPFDNRSHRVSVMAIKAIGTITENLGDGHTVKVDWHRVDPVREWYFFTYRGTIWRVLPGDNWHIDALIAFTFENMPQEIDRFRNAPYWRERFGDEMSDEKRYAWTGFYEAVADKLLDYRDKRPELVEGIYDIAGKVGGMSHLQDRFQDGTTGQLKDICPFTIMGTFNRGITDANRRTVCAELATMLNVSEPVPESFAGIPVLNNLKSIFFGFEINRQPDDIDALWEVFSRAIAFSASDDTVARDEFASAYNNVAGRFIIGWNLTFGLYWIRPWDFIALDIHARGYLEKKLNIDIGLNGPKKGYCSANDYLTVRDTLEKRFHEDTYPVRSFPELARESWLYKHTGTYVPQGNGTDPPTTGEDEQRYVPEDETRTAPLVPYSLDNIVNEGCFIARDKLESMLERLRSKKNLILQGPPGTGKTWLARKLAFALIGQRDESKIRSVQFHPNLSYEDFVRGWRPAGDGKLTLVDGPFIAIRDEAEKDPDTRYVLVIEEINRGNPAQIFGEMLTLLETDKRTPNEALELVYSRTPDERFFIPNNLFVIGTMNIADRSLALVDLALRRRFAFIDLEPTLGKPWRDWVHSKNGIDEEALVEIEHRIDVLNQTISDDPSLGVQFRVGHSYVTPPFEQPIDNGKKWFRDVVNTEIGPLLDEYWFENLEASTKAKHDLLVGFQE